MTEQVAVIMPCYNAARYLPRALRSALGQSYPHLTVTVVDDGSTDDFAAAIEPFRHRVHVVHQPNQGVATARNRAIDAVPDATYYAFLDADDAWEPEKVARQVQFLRTRPEVGLVHTERTLVDPDDRPASGAAIEHPAPATGWCRNALLHQNSVIISSVMVRGGTLGGHRFVRACECAEDWDMWIRLAGQTRFGFLEAPLTAYRVHPSNASANTRRMTRAMATVMDHALRLDDLSADDRRLARARRRAIYADLGHACFEDGDWLEARRSFRIGRGSLGRAGRIRFAISLLPASLAGRLVRLRRAAS